MRTSEQIQEIAAALAKAQGQMKNPAKNKKAKIPTKSGKEYEYNYADLSETIDCAREALAKNELSHTAATSIDASGRVLLTVRLSHSSGQWYESALPFAVNPDPKGMAATMTYFRRYLLTALIGVAADEDLDSDPETDDSKYEDRKPKTTPVTPQTKAPVKPTHEPILPGVSSNKPGPKALATDKERDHISRLAEQRKWTTDQVVDFMQRKWAKRMVKELTIPEYQELAAIMSTMAPSDALTFGAGEPGSFDDMGTNIGGQP